MDFDAGVSCVLVAPGHLIGTGRSRSRHPRFIVKHVSAIRYIIDFDNQEGTVTDPMIVSILSILEEMVKAKKVVPMTYEEASKDLQLIEDEDEQRFSAVKKSLADLRPA